MTPEVNRRNFIKAAGAASSFAIAAGYSPTSYAANSKVRTGLIGTGGQGTYHIRDGLGATCDLDIVAVCDIFQEHQRSGRIYSQIANACIQLLGKDPRTDLTADEVQAARAARLPEGYYDYREMLDKEELDAVIISTPLDTHAQIALDCLDAGKWVFCEKTLTYTIEDARALVQKCNETGRFVQVGHQRRYNPKYNLGMKIAHDDGLIGRITHITAQWHRNHYWRRPWEQQYGDYVLNDQEKQYITDMDRHMNWRLYEDRSGGLFTELATHQTDIANWFMKSLPSRVFATGGLDYWRDGREVDDNIVLVYEYDVKPGDEGFYYTSARSDYQNAARVNRGYTTRFTYTSILANAKRGASELIQGELGTLELTEQDCRMFLEPAPMAEAKAKMAAAQGEEAGGSSITSGKGTRWASNAAQNEGEELLADAILQTADTYQFQAFVNHIQNGGLPRTNQMVGFTTALTALAALRSAQEGRFVEFDPAWTTFDFETPSFTEWAWNEPEKRTTDEAPETIEPAAPAEEATEEPASA